ncbi:Uncharacterised protein [Escherichia coli]|uniref:Uncharacterized protein n=1 Tax=Escherichia coli TaxID=562 RepID=A0A377B8A2_ECOLX|nr:Uncharacterised protein [Escherichia coli]
MIDKQGVVPAILDLIFGGRCPALDGNPASPLIAVASNSERRDFAVPGSPTNIKPRPVARVTNIRSTAEGLITTLRLIFCASSPRIKARAAGKLNCQPAGKVRYHFVLILPVHRRITQQQADAADDYSAGDIYSSLKCINEINDILRAINVWRISCLSEKYPESRSQ